MMPLPLQIRVKSFLIKPSEPSVDLHEFAPEKDERHDEDDVQMEVRRISPSVRSNARNAD